MNAFRYFTLILLCFSFASYGNDRPAPQLKKNKGRFYLYWGWNRSVFSNSNIRFHGADYDFTLNKMAAKDRQTPFNLGVYLNPMTATIPQYNNRLGYAINEHWSASIGEDHMKYVMVWNQMLNVNGYINLETNKQFNKTYNNEVTKITPDFLQFEHTDGLNYVNVELRRFDELFNFRKIHWTNISFNLTEGGGFGFLLPRTNTTLLSKPRYDEFHLAGYGISGVIGLNILFWDHFFVQCELKGGFINMPDIRTTKESVDRASQHFTFLQRNIVFGWEFKLK